MVTIEAVRKLALSFDGAEELPHFDKPSFRIKKKIFVTLDQKNQRACLKLSAIDQSVFSSYDPAVIFPVPNAWGKQGWTYVELKKVRKDLLRDAISCAYCQVAPDAFSKKYRKE